MGRLEDLLTLERAGQLPANMRQDLDILRRAGQIGDQAAPAEPPSLAPRVAPQGQGQPLPPETTFTQAPDLPKEESTFTKLARGPSELLGQIPVVGGVAKHLVPSTPAGWGGLAGSLAVGAIPGVGQAATAARILPPLARGVGAMVGGMGGAAAGGETDPGEIAREGLLSGAGQLGGELGGKALATGGGALLRQLKGGVSPLLKDYGQKLSSLIPDIDPADFTPSKFFEVVAGGKGHRSLDKMYKAGIDEITSKVGPNAFIQDPAVSRIISEHLPKSKMVSSLSTITQPLRAQGATAPAHMVLGGAQGGQPVSIQNAVKAAQEIGARARLAAAKPEGAILGRELRQVNEELREAIANNLDQMAPDMGAKYREINDAFRKGSTVLEILKDNVEAIFPQGISKPKINTEALARTHNLALEELSKLGPAGEALASASRRGALPGAGDISKRVPGTSLLFGGGGISGRLTEGGLKMPFAAMPPGGSQPIDPLLSGAAGQTIFDLLRSNQSEKDKRRLLEQLGLTK